MTIVILMKLVKNITAMNNDAQTINLTLTLNHLAKNRKNWFLLQKVFSQTSFQ